MNGLFTLCSGSFRLVHARRADIRLRSHLWPSVKGRIKCMEQRISSLIEKAKHGPLAIPTEAPGHQQRVQQQPTWTRTASPLTTAQLDASRAYAVNLLELTKPLKTSNISTSSPPSCLEAQAMIDTSPSSRTKAAYIKSSMHSRQSRQQTSHHWACGVKTVR